MLNIVEGHLFGGECPAAASKNSTVDDSQILTNEDLSTLEGFFGNRTFSLNSVYKSNGRFCNGAAWKKNVTGKTNLLTVTKTIYGKVQGAFSSVAIDNFNSYHFINDPNAQIFSLSAK